jgi:hypothetical protein
VIRSSDKVILNLPGLLMGYDWYGATKSNSYTYSCGYCGLLVGSEKCYASGSPWNGGTLGAIYICPSCKRPTFIGSDGERIPASRIGNDVKGITDSNVHSLFLEARNCTGVGAYTAAVLLCRKLLMNLAVHHGAVENLKFIEYVEYLNNNGYIPPNGKQWVDMIRVKGNEATHEIALMEENDAKQLINFTEMLLRFIYEFPSMINP